MTLTFIRTYRFDFFSQSLNRRVFTWEAKFNWKTISFDPCITVLIVLNLKKALLIIFHLKNRIHVTAFRKASSMEFESRYRQNIVFLTRKKNFWWTTLFFPFSDVTETNCTSQIFSKLSQNAKNFKRKTTKEISYQLNFFFSFWPSVFFALLVCLSLRQHISTSKSFCWQTLFKVHCFQKMPKNGISFDFRKNWSIFFLQAQKDQFFHVGSNGKHSTCTKLFHWKLFGFISCVRFLIDQ